MAVKIPHSGHSGQSGWFIERPPPESGKYLTLRSTLPVTASRKQRNLSSLKARVFPSGDAVTVLGRAEANRAPGRERIVTTPGKEVCEELFVRRRGGS